jgi:uncharacterized membrane protein
VAAIGNARRGWQGGETGEIVARRWRTGAALIARAEVVSSYYIVGFAGNAVPVIGVGLMTHAMGSMIADASFGAVIILFAIVALFAAAWVRERRRPGSIPAKQVERRGGHV